MADTGKSSRIKVLDASEPFTPMRAGAQDMAVTSVVCQAYLGVKLCCLRSSWYFHVRGIWARKLSFHLK